MKSRSNSTTQGILVLVTIYIALIGVPVGGQIAGNAQQRSRRDQSPQVRHRSEDLRLSTLNSQPSSASRDYSRLLRVWDIRSGLRSREDPYSRVREPGDRMILSCSVPALEDFPVITAAGFTLCQTDSDHLSTEETAPGVWDFTRPDIERRRVVDYGLDWCYFPHFAFPPRWYRDRVPFTRLQCLEHMLPIQAFSPWEPKFISTLDRDYKQLSDHFIDGKPDPQRHREPSSLIPHASSFALYLGIHGDYGECGFPIGARVAVPGQRDDWQKRFGDLHDHAGWWCADPLARKSFQDAMIRKYRDMDILNAAWNTKLRSRDQIVYPASPSGVSRRNWLDFVHWYLDSGTAMADTVCKSARKPFPDTLLMIPVGLPDENPRGGSDISAIVKLAARHHADVRSTHGAFKPFAQNQATMFGRVSSACRHYGVPFWSEPPGRITPDQESERIFAAASAGSNGFFEWADNVRANPEVFYKNGKFLKVEKPIIDVAMFFPTTSHLLRPDAGYPQTFEKGCAAIRDVLNYDIVDERMINDGALDHIRVLVMWEGAVVEAETLSRIREWVRDGGTLAAYDFGKIETVDGDRSWFNDLFGYAGKLVPVKPATGPEEAPANSSTRPDSDFDLQKLRTEWARPFGSGWTVYYPATRRNLNAYTEIVRYLTYHLTELDKTKRDAPAVDDAWDGVYATLMSDKILYYNTTPRPVTRTIVLSPDAFRANTELMTPSKFTHTITLEPNTITPIYFDAPPNEMLLSCEKFLDLGPLKPIAGTAFHPGQGMTHVLIPVGGQISTRFEIETPGSYRVFYRAFRRGAQARTDIFIDGRPVSDSQLSTLNSQLAAPDTLLAGAVSLAMGKHTLMLRPRLGEDIRADFVIIGSDRIVEGYRFAPRRPPVR